MRSSRTAEGPLVRPATATPAGALTLAPREQLRDADGSGVTSGVTRRALWLPTARWRRASWLHLPAAGRMRSAGVVVCGPAGHEYTHSYRTLLRLADRLAAAGLPTLRFDYYASGSSPGTPLEGDLVQTWIDDIRAAATLIEDLTGRPASFVGLRLGAALGATAATRIDIDHFVAWAPVTSGRRYVREQTALAGTGAATNGSRESFIEPAGFVLARQTLDDLRSLDLSRGTYRIAGDALVLERDDLPRPTNLSEILQAQGVVTEVRTAAGYVAMMEKPHFSVVPETAVDSIVDWLDHHAPRHVALRSPQPPDLPAASAVTSLAEEELLHVPGHPPLFGVLTTSRVRPAGTRPLLLLTNAGSAHTAGPNRIYVEIARSLAAAGIATLRLDLSNLGDCIRGRSPIENHPYPPTAAADVRRALDWLRRSRRVDRVVLGGLCSGAYTAFVCGPDPQLHGLEGLLMINPLTFEWSEGDTLVTPSDAHYHASVRDPKRWRKLLNGDYDAEEILRFVSRAAWERGRDFVAGSLERSGLLPPRSLGRNLLRIAQERRRLDFVFSRFDPGYDLLMARAGAVVKRLQREGALSITVVNGADHSFSQAARRRELVRTIAARLIQYPVASAVPSPTTTPDVLEGKHHVSYH